MPTMVDPRIRKCLISAARDTVPSSRLQPEASVPLAKGICTGKDRLGGGYIESWAGWGISQIALGLGTGLSSTMDAKQLERSQMAKCATCLAPACKW